MRLFLEKHPHTFDPETVEILSTALDDAWSHVQANGGAAFKEDGAAREALAKCIVDTAKEGERNRQRLVEKALLRFSREQRVAPIVAR
jgi:hypothetical protein